MQHEMEDSLLGAESTESAVRRDGRGIGTAVEDDEPAPELVDAADSVDAGTMPTFLSEIARKMLAAVEAERSRISAETADSLDAHVRTVRMRASEETEELRRLAEADVSEIDGWSVAEAERLRREADSRIAARRDDLDRHLRQHDALIEREISGASEAVEQYQTELDEFVKRLSDEGDPTDIAQLAHELPEPPPIAEVASAARAEAIAEMSRVESPEDVAAASLGLIGVMDTSVIKARTGFETVKPAEEDQPEAPRAHATPGGRSTASLAIRLVLATLVILLVVAALLVLMGRVTLPT
jgi:hypothetical protein